MYARARPLSRTKRIRGLARQSEHSGLNERADSNAVALRSSLVSWAVVLCELRGFFFSGAAFWGAFSLGIARLGGVWINSLFA